jgi:peptidoglycan/LPS O-acetylase OafA/YrhL
MKHLPSPITYREDINGLRAWAIVAVLLFHFQATGMMAGFVGVDVFFVISGYLMTAIIVQGLMKGNFSIWRFYQARIRRILPALMVLIATLLSIGWFMLPTPDYQSLATESTHALTFSSNVHYYLTAGYFDTSAHEKWLLHTWSLAIEFQFYVLFPLFLTALWWLRPQKSTLWLGLISLFIMSLLLNVFVTSIHPIATFYLLPTRGWELTMGGLVFMTLQQRGFSPLQKRWLQWTGWALFVFSLLTLSSESSWTGGWAVPPVLAAAFIILANQQSNWLTMSSVAQWLGDRSYSLYLWHWPLVVALGFANLAGNLAWTLAAVALSLVLAHWSYIWVETPTRKHLSAIGFKREIVTIAIAASVIAAAGISIQHTEFTNRIDANIEQAAKESLNVDERKLICHEAADEMGSPECIYGTNKLGALVIGDSHAQAVMTAIGDVAEQHGLGIMNLTYSGCTTIEGVQWAPNTHTPSYKCAQFNDYAFAKAAEHPQLPLIIVNRNSESIFGPNEADRQAEHNIPRIFFSTVYNDSNDPAFLQEVRTHYVSTICKLTKEHPVFVMRPIPEIGIDVPKRLSRAMLLGQVDGDVKIPLSEYRARNDFVWSIQDDAAQQCGATILNPLPYLCDKDYCYGSRDGQPWYFDDDHLSEYGNRLLTPLFETVFSGKE